MVRPSLGRVSSRAQYVQGCSTLGCVPNTVTTAPRSRVCCAELHEDIRYSAYRTAAKMRDMQVYMRRKG